LGQNWWAKACVSLQTVYNTQKRCGTVYIKHTNTDIALVVHHKIIFRTGRPSAPFTTNTKS